MTVFEIDVENAIKVFLEEKLQFGNLKHIKALKVLRNVNRNSPRSYEKLKELKMTLEYIWGYGSKRYKLK